LARSRNLSLAEHLLKLGRPRTTPCSPRAGMMTLLRLVMAATEFLKNFDVTMYCS
jgi:hypothetical protein